MLLGLREATAYELVGKGYFEIVEVLGKRRITKDSFQKWYDSQSDYLTIADQERDADIFASTYSMPEIARMLGVHRQNIYDIAAKGYFDFIKIGRQKRVTKESFKKWYQNQKRYKLIAEAEMERG